MTFKTIVNTLAGRFLRMCSLAALLLVASCQSTPPVQEMSDARQAIAVAISAGAAEFAESDLRAAEAFLASAQNRLAEQAYSLARRDALQARDKALEALAVSENPEFQKEN
jgi:hypothetical protein